MTWERIDAYNDLRIGDWVMWLPEDDLQLGIITEMANSPEGTVFWLSCAPFWVKASEVMPTKPEYHQAVLHQHP